MGVDLVLSSGFLAFGRQAGFLRAVEEAGVRVDGICGTSSGALAGALWASGMSAEDVLERLSRRAPLSMARPHLRPWTGAFSLDAVVAELRDLLPATFGLLGRPFGVGVMAPDGTAKLITWGPLPEAVAASCAVPYLFAPVDVEGTLYQDGGAVDRTALDAWREYRPRADLLVHLVERTGPGDDPDLVGIPHVRSPPSGAKLWGLGDVRGRFEETRRRTAEVLGR